METTNFIEGEKYWLMYMHVPIEKTLLKKEYRIDGLLTLTFDFITADNTKVFKTKKELLNSL